MALKKAVLLDRDGTLIQDGPYLSDPAGIRFLDGVLDSLRLLKRHGFLLILITNQSGVGRGLFSEETVNKIHARLQSLLESEGVKLDAVYYCPHSPEAQCGCRKPQSGLFQEAFANHGIDPAKSYAVGDKKEDAMAAKRVGCKTVLVGSGAFDKKTVDFQAEDFSAAVKWILKDAGGINAGI